MADFMIRFLISSRMHYHLWFLLLILLAVPFLPIRLPAGHDILSWIHQLENSTLAPMEAPPAAAAPGATGTSAWMNDFALSVGSKTPSAFGWVLFGIWIAGIMEILRLYNRCLLELNIEKKIPIYSTAFLKSPMLAGIFRPYICLPLHLVSDYKESCRGGLLVPSGCMVCAKGNAH